ncbi:MAG TPA: biopolymer transporter Tol, partial [Candidatus Kapabacteria bacterium]|nr:biopolymer transporter Tol [Candidatus Kapabacteria bacterium]
MKKVVFVLALFSAVSAFAQFGKNKVQYKNFDWYYIQSDHLDIYFSKGGEYLANFVADEGEKSLKSIENSVNYQIVTRIPIVVYNSHNDWQQTNVVGEYLEEGVGGVTEEFKNRVVVPFEGSYKQFRHVINHELTHAVINEMFYGGSLQSMISENIQLQLPLWMNEGLAEYESLHGWDVNSDMFLRDAVMNNYLPDIDQLEGYFAYRGGQSVWYYIDQKYGKEKVGEILNRIRASHSIEYGFKSAIGIGTEELSKEWHEAERKIYWPDIAKRQSPTDFAERLTDHKKDQNFYNTGPAISPDGDKVVYISDRDQYFDVYVQSLVHRDEIRKIVSGYTTSSFEELHLLTPGLSWSSDNRHIALAAKAGDQDAIYIIDTKTGDQQKLEFSLDGIGAVAWSPVKQQFAFVGNKGGQSDIYLYDVETKSLTNLTNDIFSDGEPSFSPDGESIYFTSDRDSFLVAGKYTDSTFKIWRHNFEQLSVYKLDVATRTITRITHNKGADDASPVACDNGKTLLYISDKNGINNIYKLNLATGEDVAVTNSLSGIYQLTISQDNEKLVFASLNNAGFDVFLLRNPLEHMLSAVPEQTAFFKSLNADTSTAALPPVKQEADTLRGYGDYSIDITGMNAPATQDIAQNPVQEQSNTLQPSGNVDANGNYVVQKYKTNFTPDLIYGNAAYNTFFGAQGATEMLFSDMLGNNQIFFSANLYSDLKTSNFALAYFYLPNRIDWAFEGFHTAGLIYYPDNGNFFRFTQWGGLVQAQYPFDKFNRLNMSLNWLNLSREDLNDIIPTLQHMVLMPEVSYTHDDVMWGYIAPIDGTRYYASLTASPKFGGQGLSFYTLDFDYRRYFKFWRDYSFVLRGAGGGSFGADAQHYAIGGVENWITVPPLYLINTDEDYAFLTLALPLRGYDYGQEVGTKYLLSNVE